MSLINEALKKAQHQRSGPMDAPPMPGGGSGARHGSSGMPRNTIVLLIAGAVVVVVISVVGTVYFINRAPAPQVAANPPAIELGPITIPKAVAHTEPVPGPVGIAPIVINLPTPAPQPVVQTPSPASAAPAPALTTASAPAPDAATAVPPPTAAASAPATDSPLADRIADYLDKLRVMGIRTSDSGSKVLMNDKVYRVNDVVNRALGLKLVKIASDTLTFEDAKGATYTKNL